MSKRRVLSFKPQLRLEWRGQDGKSETEQPDHFASLGDFITINSDKLSVHTGAIGNEPSGPARHLFSSNSRSFARTNYPPAPGIESLCY
jgi:hypothetical protein